MNFAIRGKSWFKPNRYAIYLITGYGPINSTLHKRRISDTNGCPICGENEETTDHIIFDCAEYRWTEMAEYRDRKMELIRNQNNLEKFNKFAKDVFERRQETT